MKNTLSHEKTHMHHSQGWVISICLKTPFMAMVFKVVEGPPLTFILPFSNIYDPYSAEFCS